MTEQSNVISRAATVARNTQSLPRPAKKTTEAAPRRTPLARTLLHIAWLAVLLGLFIQGLLLAANGFDGWLENHAWVADLVQKISWSVLVCVGLALGRGAIKLMESTGRAVSEGTAMTVAGVSGLLAAPAAFTVARSLQQGVQEALALEAAQPVGVAALVVLIKAVEYAALGAALAWLGNRTWGRAGAHAATGLLTGIIFGGALIAVLSDGTPESLAALLPRAINEVVHPIGCALALYAAEVLARGGQSAPEITQ